jgi:hypothetical protein
MALLLLPSARRRDLLAGADAAVPGDLIHAGHAELAGCLVSLLAGVSHAGTEPLPEHAGVRLEEDVHDFLARVGQAAEDLGPVGVADSDIGTISAPLVLACCLLTRRCRPPAAGCRRCPCPSSPVRPQARGPCSRRPRWGSSPWWAACAVRRSPRSSGSARPACRCTAW